MYSLSWRYCDIEGHIAKKQPAKLDFLHLNSFIKQLHPFRFPIATVQHMQRAAALLCHKQRVSDLYWPLTCERCDDVSMMTTRCLSDASTRQWMLCSCCHVNTWCVLFCDNRFYGYMLYTKTYNSQVNFGIVKNMLWLFNMPHGPIFDDTWFISHSLVSS